MWDSRHLFGGFPKWPYGQSSPASTAKELCEVGGLGGLQDLHGQQVTQNLWQQRNSQVIDLPLKYQEDLP